MPQPELWRETLGNIHRMRAAGHEANAQVGIRPIGVIMGLETTVHPFAAHPVWRELRDLTPAARYQRLSTDADLRRRLLAPRVGGAPAYMGETFHKMFPSPTGRTTSPISPTRSPPSPSGPAARRRTSPSRRSSRRAARAC